VPTPWPDRRREPVRDHVGDAALIARIAALEARIDEQDAALRRVLTLLVDWVEGERQPDLASIRAAGR
jgi:hypothetical protein